MDCAWAGSWPLSEGVASRPPIPGQSRNAQLSCACDQLLPSAAGRQQATGCRRGSWRRVVRPVWSDGACREQTAQLGDAGDADRHRQEGDADAGDEQR